MTVNDYYVAALEANGVGGLALLQVLEPGEQMVKKMHGYVLSADGRLDLCVPFWMSVIAAWRVLKKWRES